MTTRNDKTMKKEHRSWIENICAMAGRSDEVDLSVPYTVDRFGDNSIWEAASTVHLTVIRKADVANFEMNHVIEKKIRDLDKGVYHRVCRIEKPDVPRLLELVEGPPYVKCDRCEAGYYEKECWYCFGDGTDKCDYCGHHGACSECHGRGTVSEKCDCDPNTGLRNAQNPQMVRIGYQVFDLKKIYWIASKAPDCSLAFNQIAKNMIANPDNYPIRIEGGSIWDAYLMPYNYYLKEIDDYPCITEIGAEV